MLALVLMLMYAR